MRPGVEVTVTREPVGVVTAITPMELPIAIPAWKIAPAWPTATPWCSNPPSWSPLARGVGGHPQPRRTSPGAPNLVLGRGSQVGPVLTGSPEVDAVTFTGSVGTGQG